MKKKGFTLVELLAVVAILGILVIMAMPNVLESFTTARTNTFKSNATKLISAAQTDFITDRMKPDNLAKTHFVYSNIEGGKPLKLSSTGGLTYCIVMDLNGKITYFEATNSSTNIKASGNVTPEYLSTLEPNDGEIEISCNSLITPPEDNPEDDIPEIFIDTNQNEYVWIDVPRTTTVYPTVGTNLTSFNDEIFVQMEKDLHSYTASYRNNTSFKDEHPNNLVLKNTGLTAEQYKILKQKMLKSVYLNQGFYIGKYEAGVLGSARTVDSQGDISTLPVIRPNAYPYNQVSRAEAQTLSSKLAPDGYISSLMFGVQWDLVLKHLEVNGITSTQMKNADLYGNFYSSSYNITNSDAKYKIFADGKTWVDAPYGKKTSNDRIILSTAASDNFKFLNIYDLAGNMYEWTLEYSMDTDDSDVRRGGSYFFANSENLMVKRSFMSTNERDAGTGFRVALYFD